MEQLIINNGFIKLSRAILEWEWYDHPDVTRVFIHLVLKVNYAPGKWRGIDISIGEHITSINKISKELAMSEFKVRQSLINLEKTFYIEIQTTNKFTRLKLINSILYNNNLDINHKQIQHQSTNQKQTNQKETTTNYNNKENKEIEERKEFFKNEILKFSNNFSQVHINTFFEYWSIENNQTGQLKFEEENFWNLELKLKSWKVFSKTTDTIKLSKNRP